MRQKVTKKKTITSISNKMLEIKLVIHHFLIRLKWKIQKILNKFSLLKKKLNSNPIKVKIKSHIQ